MSRAFTWKSRRFYKGAVKSDEVDWFWTWTTIQKCSNHGYIYILYIEHNKQKFYPDVCRYCRYRRYRRYWCQRVCGEVDQEMNDVQGPRFHSRINFALHSGLSVGCVTTRGNTRTDGQLGAARAHYHHSYQHHTANNITSSLASLLPEI